MISEEVWRATFNTPPVSPFNTKLPLNCSIIPPLLEVDTSKSTGLIALGDYTLERTIVSVVPALNF